MDLLLLCLSLKGNPGLHDECQHVYAKTEISFKDFIF